MIKKGDYVELKGLDGLFEVAEIGSDFFEVKDIYNYIKVLKKDCRLIMPKRLYKNCKKLFSGKPVQYDCGYTGYVKYIGNGIMNDEGGLCGYKLLDLKLKYLKGDK